MIFKSSIAPSKNAVTYYQTIEEVTWRMRQEKLDKRGIFSTNLKLQVLSKNQKNAKF